MTRRCRRSPARLLGTLVCLWSTLPTASADWPGFRGPRQLGISDERGLPVEWSGTRNIAWKVALPGPGSSSPVTWGDRVFVTCYTGYGTDKEGGDNTSALRRVVLALDRKTGTTLWQQEVPAKQPEYPYRGNLTQHGYAASTPATDGERLYVFFGKTGVLAYDLDGKRLWEANVGSGTHQWGSGSSPVLYKGLVIINAGVESGALVALDKQSGKEVWRAPGIRQAWGTPVLVDVPGGKPELVMNLPRSVVGYDPDTGKELWRCQGVEDNYVCTSAVAKDGIVYVVGGRKGNGAMAVKAGGRGDVRRCA